MPTCNLVLLTFFVKHFCDYQHYIVMQLRAQWLCSESESDLIGSLAYW